MVERTLAERINQLFAMAEDPPKRPLSNAAAAAAITARTGVRISAAYLWQLRTGRKTNPSIAHLRAIAEFFGVPARTLVEDSRDVADAPEEFRGPAMPGRGALWRVTGLLRMEDPHASNPRQVCDTADPAEAAEQATEAIAVWVRAAMAASMSAPPTHRGGLEQYLPRPLKVHVKATQAAAAQRAIEELALRVEVVPEVGDADLAPK